MKQIIESIRSQISERLSSPLFGAFAVSWLVWNHQYLFVLFSDGDVSKRLELARALSFPDHLAIVLRGVVYPLLSGTAFILIYPYPSLWLFSYWYKRQRWTKDARDRIEGLALLTLDESKQIRLAVLKEHIEHEKTVEAMSKQIEDLKASAKSSAKRIQDSNNLVPVAAPVAEKTGDEGILKVMSYMATKENGKGSDREFYASLAESSIKLEHYLDLAFAQKLVSRGGNPGSIELTGAGRKFLVNSKLV